MFSYQVGHIVTNFENSYAFIRKIFALHGMVINNFHLPIVAPNIVGNIFMHVTFDFVVESATHDEHRQKYGFDDKLETLVQRTQHARYAIETMNAYANAESDYTEFGIHYNQNTIRPLVILYKYEDEYSDIDHVRHWIVELVR